MRFVSPFLFAILAVAAPATAQNKAGPSIAPAGEVLSVKQLTVTVDPAGDAKANGERVAAFQTATLGIFSCTDADEVAKTVGAEVVTNEGVPFSALPPALQKTVAAMKVGTATQMFGDRATGKISVLVLCARK